MNQHDLDQLRQEAEKACAGVGMKMVIHPRTLLELLDYLEKLEADLRAWNGFLDDDK